MKKVIIQDSQDRFEEIENRLNQLECRHNNVVFIRHPYVKNGKMRMCNFFTNECMDCGKTIQVYNTQKEMVANAISYYKSELETIDFQEKKK